MLTQDYLKECLDYNEETGEFKWKARPESHFKTKKSSKTWNTRYAYTRAGTNFRNKYVMINFSGGMYLAHRLAWMYAHGHMPPDQIDHINGNGKDNRISNIRSVTAPENSKNLARAKNNTTGVTGVSKNPKRYGKPWRARIKVNKVERTLGYFDSFEEAVKVRKQAEADLGFHPNHGRAGNG